MKGKQVLLVKLDLKKISANREEPLSGDLILIDELCGGLLSRARFQGRLEELATSASLTWIAVNDSTFKEILLWNSKKSFPWSQIEVMRSGEKLTRGIKYFYWGNFSKDELAEGKKLLGTLRIWNSELALNHRLEVGDLLVNDH